MAPIEHISTHEWSSFAAALCALQALKQKKLLEKMTLS